MDDWEENNRKYVIVVSSARSGSTLLVNLLDNHPEIGASYVEPLNPENLDKWNMTDATKEVKIENVRSYLDSNQNSVRCCKIFVEQLHLNNITIADLIEHFPACAFIVMRRENVLDTYVSLQIAYRNKIWYSMSEANEVSIDVDVNEFRTWVDENERDWKSALSELSSRKRVLYLSYEEMVADMSKCCRDIHNFLDIYPYDGLEVYSIRQNPLPIHDKINNYDKIKDSLEEILKQFQ